MAQKKFKRVSEWKEIKQLNIGEVMFRFTFTFVASLILSLFQKDTDAVIIIFCIGTLFFYGTVLLKYFECNEYHEHWEEIKE